MRDRVQAPFVFFDLGNVLVHFDHEIAVKQLAAASGRSTSEVRRAVFDSQLQERYETGLVTSQEFVREVNQALNCELAETDVLEAISAIFDLNKNILPVLEHLRSERIPMGLLSNTCPAHWDWILRQQWTIPGNWFECCVLSYEIRSMKPDPTIYEVCESKSLRDPNDLFFTDDRPENVQAANQRGWTTCLFQSSEELWLQLDAWLS
jgi:putative hydrolase of the HAD superfamily